MQSRVDRVMAGMPSGTRRMCRWLGHETGELGTGMCTYNYTFVGGS
jgi:hypothetical protein